MEILPSQGDDEGGRNGIFLPLFPPFILYLFPQSTFHTPSVSPVSPITRPSISPVVVIIIFIVFVVVVMAVVSHHKRKASHARHGKRHVLGLLRLPADSKSP